jgi:hypothetical protein
MPDLLEVLTLYSSLGHGHGHSEYIAANHTRQGANSVSD